MKISVHRLLFASVLMLISCVAVSHEEFDGRKLGACVEDIATHCATVRKGGGRVIQCLQEKRAALVEACRVAVTPSDVSNPADGLSIVVTIADVQPKKGVVIATLSDTPDMFPRGRRTFIAPAAGDKVVITFKNLKPGTYSIMAFHDENENGQFDMDLDNGMEGIVARDAGLGPPDFEASAVKVERDTQVTYSMHYF